MAIFFHNNSEWYFKNLQMGNLRLCDTLVALDSSHILETISHHAKEKDYADRSKEFLS